MKCKVGVGKGKRGKKLLEEKLYSLCKELYSVLREWGDFGKEGDEFDYARRMVDYFLGEAVWSKEVRDEELEKVLKSVFEVKGIRLVVVRDVRVFSLCPHHLLPVEYVVDCGYIANGKVLGISKLARIVEIVSKVPLLQEEFTSEIVKILDRVGIGSGCVVRGRHSCMRCRGVEQDNSYVVTQEFSGEMASLGWKEEFLNIVNRERNF